MFETFFKQQMARGGFDMFTSAGEQQRDMDLRMRHLQHLRSQFAKDERKTVAEWSDLVLRPAGWQVPAEGARTEATAERWRGSHVLTSAEFVQQFTAFPLLVSQSYAPPKEPIPSACDMCDKPCISECMCGELFCSRACLKRNWRDHREACQQVCDNTNLAVLVSRIEMQRALTPLEFATATNDTATLAKLARVEQKQTRRAQDQESLMKMAAEADHEVARNFARMRANERGPVKVDQKVPGFFTVGNVADRLDENVRCRAPTHRAAYAAWCRVESFERQLGDESASECIASLAFCLLTDQTAMNIVTTDVNRQPGWTARAYPRTVAALQAAVKAVGNAKSAPAPACKSAVEALTGLALFAMQDRELGDPVKLWDRAIDTPTLCCHLAQRHVAAAVFLRGTTRMLQQQRSPASMRQVLKDIESARQLAEADGDVGLAWSWLIPLGRTLASLDRMPEALRAFESLADAVDLDLIINRTEPPTINARTGGRELDPYELAKVVDAEYTLAFFLMSARNDAVQSMRRGREHFASAARKEATIPIEFLERQPSEHKPVCQMLLASMPATPKTQAAIYAGLDKTSGLLECRACRRTDHDGLKLCGGCKRAAYCSPECQRADWKRGHKQACAQEAAGAPAVRKVAPDVD